MNDYELAILKADELILKNLGNEANSLHPKARDMEMSAIEKGGYMTYFMFKEIFEQPDTIFADCFRVRLDAEKGTHNGGST